MSIETRINPEEVGKRLSEDPKLAEGELLSSNQAVTLSYAAGKFVLAWSATGIGSYDWVGIYQSITAPDSDVVSGAWQWANSGSSFSTSQVIISGYQARYLVWNAGTSRYESVARTDPFPFLRVCSP